MIRIQISVVSFPMILDAGYWIVLFTVHRDPFTVIRNPRSRIPHHSNTPLLQHPCHLLPALPVISGLPATTRSSPPIEKGRGDFHLRGPFPKTKKPRAGFGSAPGFQRLIDFLSNASSSPALGKPLPHTQNNSNNSNRRKCPCGCLFRLSYSSAQS